MFLAIAATLSTGPIHSCRFGNKCVFLAHLARADQGCMVECDIHRIYFAQKCLLNFSFQAQWFPPGLCYLTVPNFLRSRLLTSEDQELFLAFHLHYSWRLHA